MLASNKVVIKFVSLSIWNGRWLLLGWLMMWWCGRGLGKQGNEPHWGCTMYNISYISVYLSTLSLFLSSYFVRILLQNRQWNDCFRMSNFDFCQFISEARDTCLSQIKGKGLTTHSCYIRFCYCVTQFIGEVCNFLSTVVVRL